MERPDSPLHELLRSSRRVLLLLGAGLSAPSGMPTYAEMPSVWRGLPLTSLSTISGFEQDPALTWAFYESMRQTALQVQPNAAHHAITELARRKTDLLAITQNIDYLSQRAGHPPHQLVAIHGSIFDTACSGADCQYRGANHSTEPLLTSLVLPTYNVLDTMTPFPKVEAPCCPYCQTHLLRPGLVWRGELLSPGTLETIDEWLDDPAPVDLMLVIGTSGGLSSGFIGDARARGAVVAHFNKEHPDDHDVIEPGDWVITGDVSSTLPRVLGEAFMNVESLSH